MTCKIKLPSDLAGLDQKGKKKNDVSETPSDKMLLSLLILRNYVAVARLVGRKTTARVG